MVTNKNQANNSETMSKNQLKLLAEFISEDVPSCIG